MVKVMVVDDEYFAREGMKRTIDWTTLGCTLCGEADNGVRGVELARELKPDIIITDIKMPGMDGISMANAIIEFLPNCKFIIITGYDEFEYAKRAIKLNAVDFILKPIDESELLQGLLKGCEIVRSLKLQRGTLIEKLLLDCMRGKFIDKSSMKEILRSNNINFQNILIVNIENDYYDRIVENGKRQELYTQNRILREVIYKVFVDEIYVVECHQDKLAVIINGDKISNNGELNEKLINIKEEINKKLGITLTIGVSKINEIIYITEAYNESKEALQYKLYSGKGKIIFYETILKESLINKEMFISEERDIILLLKARDKRKIESKLKQLYFDIFKLHKAEEHIIRQVSIEIILGALNVLKEYNLSVNEVIGEEFNVYRQAAKLNTIDELHNMVHSCIVKIIDAMREFNVEAQETGIDKVIDYINEHYCEDISLSHVAKYAYLSESYLSRKMKKVLGIGFAEYITKLRMERALELLKNPNSKITEIALNVGYQDYRYFSQIFKKYTGYSPSEFTKRKE